ncbi:hypothetical protein R6Q59_016629 [Mikania micrantha]
MTEIVSLGLLRALMEAGFTNWCFDCCSWHQECYLTMKTLESVDTEQFQWQGKKNEARDRKLNLKAEKEKLEPQLIVVCCHTPPGRPLPLMWRKLLVSSMGMASKERNVYGRKEKTVYFEIVVESLFYVLVSLGEAIADRRSNAIPRYIGAFILICARCPDMITLRNLDILHAELLAVHSWFEHSFVVYWLACNAIEQIKAHQRTMRFHGSFSASYTLEDFGGLVAVGTYVFALSSIYTTAMKFTGAS